MDIYEWADSAVNSCPRYETGFTELLATKPYLVSPAILRQYESRLLPMRSFQKIALDIFRAALNNEVHPRILHWLINETPESLGIGYHRSLEDRHFTLPVFFRTDEARPGRIIEFSCPGALWGELQLSFEHAVRMGYCSGDVSPADQFATQLIDFLKGTPPIVHDYIDRTTAPSCSRYFIEKTRPRIKYWAIDRGLRMSDCNFIRHRAFSELWSDDNLHMHLDKTGKGITYDYPPYVLFDEKAPLALPFWSITRELFTDEIRDLFPFTTPLLPTGIELQDGTQITIEEFCRWPRSRRSYYLKLAGFNTELNWGSKAVYRLSNMSSDACHNFLQQCLSGYERGQVWLLQKEEVQDDEITFFARDGTVHTQTLRAKFSGFYGPDGCLGVIAQHRGHYKVHGQEDTVLSYVSADTEDSLTA